MLNWLKSRLLPSEPQVPEQLRLGVHVFGRDDGRLRAQLHTEAGESVGLVIVHFEPVDGGDGEVMPVLDALSLRDDALRAQVTLWFDANRGELADLHDEYLASRAMMAVRAMEVWA